MQQIFIHVCTKLNDTVKQEGHPVLPFEKDPCDKQPAKRPHSATCPETVCRAQRSPQSFNHACCEKVLSGYWKRPRFNRGMATERPLAL